MEAQIHTHTDVTAGDNQQAQTVQQGQVECKVNVLDHSSRCVVSVLSWRHFPPKELKHFPLALFSLELTVTCLHAWHDV